MADVLTTSKNIQMQVTDVNGSASVVNLKTSDTAVTMFDGTSLKDWVNATSRSISTERFKLFNHMKMQHLTAGEIANLLVDSDYDEDTGKLTFTSYDGSVKELNTALNKIAVNFTMRNGDPENPEEVGKVFLVLTLEDDSTMEVDVTSLVDIYGGTNGETIVVSIDANKKVSAVLVDGSIPLKALEQGVQEKIMETYVLPIATTEALGGVKASDTISVDAETGVANADVLFLDGARVRMDLSSYNAPELVTLSASIKNTTSLELDDGTIGIELITHVGLGDNSTPCYEFGGATKVYVREVNAGMVTAFNEIPVNIKVGQSSEVPGQDDSKTTVYGTSVSSEELDHTINFTEEGISIESGKTYEVYASISLNVAATQDDAAAFVQKTAISQHKFFTYTGQTNTP